MSDAKQFNLTPLAVAVISALGASAPVLAQDDESSLAIEEILVTATKREIGLQDVPQSIDVLTSLQLERMGARDLEATMRALPSVHLTALQPGQNQLTMRGVAAEVFEYTRPALVAVYLDEQPMTSNAQQVGFRNIDINRVESLPGPQGTLFGSSSLAGTLRYITNKPKLDVFEGNIEVSGGWTEGAAHSSDFNGVLNIPLIDGKLAVRAVAYSSHDGGYVDNVFGTSFIGNYDNGEFVEEDHNEYDVDGGRLHVLWDINDRWSTLLSFTAENTEALGAWDSDAALEDYQVTRFFDEFRTDDWTTTSITLNGDLGFADLSVTATRFDRDIVYEYDNMSYSQRRDAVYGYYCNQGSYASCLYYANYYPGHIFNDQFQERDAYEIRLVSKGESRLQWVVGAYYEDFLNDWFYGSAHPNLENTAMFYWANYYAYFYGVSSNYYNNYTPNPNITYPVPVTDIAWSQDYTYSEQRTAVFGEMSYDVTDNLMVFGGLRWAEVDRDRLEQNLFPAGLVPIGDRAAGDGTFRDIGTDSDTIYKIGLQYTLSDDVMFYGLYSQGFRVGGSNSQRAAASGLVPQTYDGDFLNNYEIGIKSSLAGGRVQLNASAFSMVWEDYLQGVSGDVWWLGGTVNAGEAEASGVEVTLNARLTERLSLSSNVGFFDNEFKDEFCANYENGVNLGCVDDTTFREIRAGMRMPNAPDFKAWAGLDYEIPNVLGGDMWLHYDFSYQDGSWSGVGEIRDNDLDGLSPSMTYSNFSAGMSWPNGLDVTFAVNNLLNESDFTYIFVGEGDNADQFGSNRYQQQRAQFRPRTYWFTIRKGFGG